MSSTRKTLGSIDWSAPLLIAVATIVAVLLCGCSTTGDKLQPTKPGSVCKALIGPIKYNSQNKDSRRHAGPDLAPDLKARNQVGQTLNCPAYR